MILTLTTITRKRYASGSRGTDGRWSTTSSTSSITGSEPQTLSAQELQMLPEGERNADSRVFFTTADVRTSSQHDGVEADHVSWDSGTTYYRVLQVEPHGLYDHNRVTVSRVREAG